MAPRSRLLPAILPALLLGACAGDVDTPAVPGTSAQPAGKPPAPGRDASAGGGEAGDLVDEAQSRGLTYRNVSGAAEKPTILDAGGAGCAVLDLGGDGDLDLVFAQGLPGLEHTLSGPGADLEVFLNDGTGHFTRTQGPGLSGWWTGLATGDLDGDGDADLIAAGYGSTRVLLQQDGALVPGQELVPEGPGRLVVGSRREAGQPPSWTTSCALFDVDRDGHLDVYLGNYLDLDPVAPALGSLGEGVLALPCRWKGLEVYCGPRGMNPQPDRLLRGRGDGTFRDESAARLPGHEPGFTLALAPFDADGDGDVDLAVANDSSANLLLINDGSGVLSDRGFAAGIAYSSDGEAEAGMGYAAGDVNRDGQLDLACTNFSDEPTSLYLGAPVGFQNATHRLGLARESRRLLSWSVHLEDFDGDGWLELFTANGHVYPQADEDHTGTSYAQADTLWRIGPLDHVERRVPASQASLLAYERGTRGSAVGDLDGDGAPDLVLTHIDGPVSLGRNTWSEHSRLVVVCEGPERPGPAPRRTPRDGNGARVTLVLQQPGSGEFGLLQEVRTCEGYQSARSRELYFGCGDTTEYQQLIVLWPSGERELLGVGPTNRRLVIREGAGVVASEELR